MDINQMISEYLKTNSIKYVDGYNRVSYTPPETKKKQETNDLITYHMYDRTEKVL